MIKLEPPDIFSCQELSEYVLHILHNFPARVTLSYSGRLPPDLIVNITCEYVH